MLSLLSQPPQVGSQMGIIDVAYEVRTLKHICTRNTLNLGNLKTKPVPNKLENQFENRHLYPTNQENSLFISKTLKQDNLKELLRTLFSTPTVLIIWVIWGAQRRTSKPTLLVQQGTILNPLCYKVFVLGMHSAKKSCNPKPVRKNPRKSTI